MIQEDEISQLKCNSCAVEMSDTDESFTTDSGIFVCENCVRVCQHCSYTGADTDNWYSVSVYGSERWCQSCTENEANFCEGCSDYHTGDEFYVEDRSGSFCESCFEDSSYCDQCGEYYMDGCDRDECRESSYIHDYNYRPDPIFHGEGKLFFGLEIETEAPRDSYSALDEAAEYAASRLDSQGIAYLKSDGSLSCGFEVVTHPMTHDYFKHEATVFWDTIDELKETYNMRAWSTGTCGLHIHISRAGFSSGSHMHRFLNLVYSNEAFYTRLAGRSSDRWASYDDVKRWNDEAGHAISTYAHKLAKHGQNRSNRYSAINTLNRATLEMRIFRGTVNTGTIKSALDLAHASVEYTRTLSVQDVRNGALERMKFIQFIYDNAVTYPDLTSRMDRLFMSASAE